MYVLCTADNYTHGEQPESPVWLQTKLSVSKCGNIRPQFLPWGEISPAHPARLYHLPPFSLFVSEFLLFLSPRGFFFFCTSVSATVSISLSVRHTTPRFSYFISLLHRKRLHLARLPLSFPPSFKNPSGFFHTQHISFCIRLSLH